MPFPASKPFYPQEIFRGTLPTSIHCEECEMTFRISENFLDLQFCFPENIEQEAQIPFPELICNYFAPGLLTGIDKYQCGKCIKLCDAVRTTEIVEAPSNLILTVKLFKYDMKKNLRSKLNSDMGQEQLIRLPVETVNGSENCQLAIKI